MSDIKCPNCKTVSEKPSISTRSESDRYCVTICQNCGTQFEHPIPEVTGDTYMLGDNFKRDRK
jgi:transcription elongation factor Elf1